MEILEFAWEVVEVVVGLEGVRDLDSER